jgi:uncharacterized protein YaiI (UPF0178 family)
MTIIYVDADACPVKGETLRVAERHGLKVCLVSNGGIRPSRDPMVEVVIVPKEPDAADMWIAKRAGPGDICITADIPLADQAIKAGARALNHDGIPFTEAGIGQAMAMRDLMADIRAANPLDMPGGGGKPFGASDRSRFLNALEREVRIARQQKTAGPET